MTPSTLIINDRHFTVERLPAGSFRVECHCGDSVAIGPDFQFAFENAERHARHCLPVTPRPPLAGTGEEIDNIRDELDAAYEYRRHSGYDDPHAAGLMAAAYARLREWNDARASSSRATKAL